MLGELPFEPFGELPFEVVGEVPLEPVVGVPEEPEKAGSPRFGVVALFNGGKITPEPEFDEPPFPDPEFEFELVVFMPIPRAARPEPCPQALGTPLTIPSPLPTGVPCGAPYLVLVGMYCMSGCREYVLEQLE